MSKNIYCIIGNSGSGKTTVCDILEKDYGYKQIPSYTTRPKRNENEIGHTFVSDEEFDNLENKVAYADYRGTKYCVTQEQIDNEDYSLYVVDVSGLNSLRKNYKGNRNIVSIYIYADAVTLHNRLTERYSYMSPEERIETVAKRLSDDLFEFRGARKLCDYCVINDSMPVDYCVNRIKKIIEEDDASEKS